MDRLRAGLLCTATGIPLLRVLHYYLLTYVLYCHFINNIVYTTLYLDFLPLDLSKVTVAIAQCHEPNNVWSASRRYLPLRLRIHVRFILVANA